MVLMSSRKREAVTRSSHASTLLYEPTRTTTFVVSGSVAMPCCVRVRGGRRGWGSLDGMPAIKGSLVLQASCQQPHLA